MHVITRDIALHDDDASTFSALTNQIPSTKRHFPFQHLVAILRHPNQMILDIIDRVATRTIFHTATLKAIRLKAKVLDRAHGK